MPFFCPVLAQWFGTGYGFGANVAEGFHVADEKAYVEGSPCLFVDVVIGNRGIAGLVGGSAFWHVVTRDEFFAECAPCFPDRVVLFAVCEVDDALRECASEAFEIPSVFEDFRPPVSGF